MSRVLVAMSGGVDSSVAAALMLEAGHDVIGVTLKLWEGPAGEAPTSGCCTVSDSEDARRVAAQLDIPYYVLDYSDEFMGGVVDHFVAEYLAGMTPNPCIECNRTVKFSRLLERAHQFDCELLVTGHYARTRRSGSGWSLLRGVDRSKDQSYVLSMLGQTELARVRFPVGEMSKADTRRVAEDLGLRTADKPDSQDICFVGPGGYREFVRQRDPSAERPGPVLDMEGSVVGRHSGVVDVTIGQRHGLGVAVGEPRYVVGIDAKTATVTVGRWEDLGVELVEVGDLAWVSGKRPAVQRVQVQYRAHGDAVEAELDGNTIRFEDPQYGVAPGQTASFYAGEEVLGGAIIRSAG